MCKGVAGGAGGAHAATTYGPLDPAVAAKRVREALSCLNQALYEAFAAGVRCEVSSEIVQARELARDRQPLQQTIVAVRCWREM